MKEKDNMECVECDDGFALYIIKDNIIYLSDIYVKPEKRRTRISYDLADKVVEIGKENNCTILLGSIDKELKTKERSKKVLTNYGYKYINEDESFYWYKKDI
jgi:hypothetical protein